MRILILTIGLFVTSSLFGQIAFFNIYSNNGDESGEGIVQLEDSSYMVTGSSSSFAPSLGSQAFLLHIDSLGNFISSTHYGGPESEVGRRVLYQPNDGYYIAGYTNSYGNGGYDYYLVKTDLNGVEQWSQTYGGAGWERVWDAAIMPDSGVMMIGETSSNPTDNLDMYIVRTDKFGDTLWTKTIGGAGDDVLKGMDSLNDSTFYLVGSAYIEDSSYTKGMLFRIHENGTIERQDTINNYENTYFNDITIKPTLEMAVVGYNIGVNSNDRDSYFLKFDLNGDLNHAYSGQDNGIQYVEAVSHCNGNNDWYLGLNYFNQWSQPDGDDVALAKYSNAMIWQGNMVIVSYEKPETIGQIIETSDDGVIIVGKTNFDGATFGVRHVFVGKIGKNDSIPDWVNPVYSGIVGVQEVNLLDELKVYPNPVDNELVISSDPALDTKVSLVNALGQVVMEERLEFGTINLYIDHLKNGVYFLTATTGSSSTTRRIVIQH